mmetsp:Transcript_3308/g.5012  ORF Transcript_3308/g.5012 Transcript_3308/m.5012 type:complete len:175 (+) Transcript_3308:204-728(+)
MTNSKRGALSVLLTGLTLVLYHYLSASNMKADDGHSSKRSVSYNRDLLYEGETIETSQFPRSVAAIIRFNQYRPDRMELMLRYRRHFDKLFISYDRNSSLLALPTPLEDVVFVPCDTSHLYVYDCIGTLLAQITQDVSISGALYLRFDFLVVPPLFANENFERIWHLNLGPFAQ